MRKEEVKRRACYFDGLFVLCLILYSCLKDESDWELQKTSNGVIKGKNRELSLEAALSWYEANQTPVVSTRSVDTKFELLSKLHWEKGLESRKEKFEVVEVPLLNKGGAVLMDSQTMEKCKETERGKIRNISRMVIIKNLETGEIINFVMHIIGTYDYLMNAKHFEENSYLYRDPHFSGSVYFYESEGSLVNGWKYEDGKIVATIKQGTKEGVQMQTEAASRGFTVHVCHFENILVEYNDCNPTLYQDPEYGLEIGIECRKKTKWETVEVCEDIYYDESGNSQTWYPEDNNNHNGGGGGGSTNGGYIPKTPKAKAIFRNSKMTENNWEALEKMLNKMTGTSIGNALYNKIVETLSSKTIILEFVENSNSLFDPSLSTIKLRTDASSGVLFHEMFHLLQSYTEQETWNGSALNRDVEAHLAQQIYINSLPESERIWWREKSKKDARWNATRELTGYIDENGKLRPEFNEVRLQKLLENRVIKSFRRVGYTANNYPWLNSRIGTSNFNTIRILSQ